MSDDDEPDEPSKGSAGHPVLDSIQLLLQSAIHHDQDRLSYLEYRQELNKLRLASLRDYEKNLILLASGELVLSVTYIQAIGSTPRSWWILVISWVFTGCALVAILISYLTSARSLREEIYSADVEEAVRVNAPPPQREMHERESEVDVQLEPHT